MSSLQPAYCLEDRGLMAGLEQRVRLLERLREGDLVLDGHMSSAAGAGRPDCCSVPASSVRLTIQPLLSRPRTSSSLASGAIATRFSSHASSTAMAGSPTS